MTVKTSEKQSKANRQNSKYGGVKTVKGKETIRFNARKHGILANIVADYESKFHQNYMDQLYAELKPQNMLEELLVERIAIHYLKLFRLMKAESDHINYCVAGGDYNFEDCFSRGSNQPELSIKQFGMVQSIFQRYETTTENRLYRALKELRELRSYHQMGLFGENA